MGATRVDIIDKLRIEANREPHEPVWRETNIRSQAKSGNANAGVTGLPPAQTVELPPKPAGGRSELT